MVAINWPLLIAQVITFLAALFIVWKLFWGPLTRMMRERTQKISDDIQKAESGRREVEALEAEYRQRLAEIEEKARKELNVALQQGLQAKEDILRQARQEAQRIMEKAQQDLTRERDKVIRELRQDIAEIALQAVERLLGQDLDATIQKRWMEKILQDLEKIKVQP